MQRVCNTDWQETRRITGHNTRTASTLEVTTSMGSITLNTRVERRKLLNKNTRTRIDTKMIGMKKNTFQFELKNSFTALKEHDDMDSLNKNMTEMIQQSATSIAKQTKKQKKPKMSSPTRALMK